MIKVLEKEKANSAEVKVRKCPLARHERSAATGPAEQPADGAQYLASEMVRTGTYMQTQARKQTMSAPTCASAV
eukprot:scaffold322527_cov33-Tisochrysis_lutea.AAC.4